MGYLAGRNILLQGLLFLLIGAIQESSSEFGAATCYLSSRGFRYSVIIILVPLQPVKQQLYLCIALAEGDQSL